MSNEEYLIGSVGPNQFNLFAGTLTANGVCFTSPYLYLSHKDAVRSMRGVCDTVRSYFNDKEVSEIIETLGQRQETQEETS